MISIAQLVASVRSILPFSFRMPRGARPPPVWAFSLRGQRGVRQLAFWAFSLGRERGVRPLPNWAFSLRREHGVLPLNFPLRGAGRVPPFTLPMLAGLLVGGRASLYRAIWYLFIVIIQDPDSRAVNRLCSLAKDGGCDF